MTPHCFKFLAIQRHDSLIVVGPSSKDEKASGDPFQPGEADAAGHPAEVRGRAQEDEPARHRLGTGGIQLGAASELVQPAAGGSAQVEEQPGDNYAISVFNHKLGYIEEIRIVYLPRPQGPQLNHWLSRTFVPPLNAVVGQEISLPALPASPTDSEEEEEIPDVLQGEIARLEPRFKVGFFSQTIQNLPHSQYVDDDADYKLLTGEN